MARKAAPLAPATVGRKRKAPTFCPVAAGKRTRALASGWASLPTDLTRIVALRVLAGDVVDYIAFRGVCSDWRACTPSQRDPTLRQRSLRPRGWVALCGGDAVRPDDAGEITFLHTRTARCLRVSLPELRRYRIVGFTEGLLILLHKRDTTVRVLHPFTRVAVDLPPLAPAYHEVVRNRNSLLDMRASVCTASATSIAVVVWFPWTPGVLCATPLGPGWEVIHKDMELGNTLLFQAKFGDPCLWQCQYYLVESGRHMLLVVVHQGNVERGGTEPWQRSAFAMFRVDISDRWRLFPVRSLGNQALFLRKDRSFERPSTLCQVHDTEERVRPSVRPFTIADHLLTYCSHREWANGLMFHEFRGIPKSFEDLHRRIRKQDSQLRIPCIRAVKAKGQPSAPDVVKTLRFRPEAHALQ